MNGNRTEARGVLRRKVEAPKLEVRIVTELRQEGFSIKQFIDIAIYIVKIN